MAYLACLGSVLSPTLRLNTFLDTQPRVYIVFIGESGVTRKSSAVNKTVKHFKKNVDGLKVRYGLGSPEGLQKIVGKADNDTPSRILLIFDEFKTFVDKATIASSVLLSCVNTLFEINIFENVTKKSHINLQNTHLSIVGATTKLTYETIYSDQFTRIGFPNRVFIVPGGSERKFSIPPALPESEESRLGQNLVDVVKHVGDGLTLDLTPDARAIYDSWYMAGWDGSVHATRLDTYSLRLMMLLAANSCKTVIDAETVNNAIALCDWQLEVRKLYDPIDADNSIARMEEKIRRCITSRGPQKEWELKQNTNAKRAGYWVFEKAKENLRSAGEIQWDKGRKSWIGNQV